MQWGVSTKFSVPRIGFKRACTSTAGLPTQTRRAFAGQKHEMQMRSLSEVAPSLGMEVPAAHTPKIGRPSGRRSSLPVRDAVVGNLGDAFTPSHGARTTWAAACSPSGESDADEVTMRAPADACGSLAC